MAVRPGGAIDPAARMTRVLNSQEARIRQVFNLALTTIIDQHTLDNLASLLEQGRIEEALAGVEEAGDLIGNSYGDSLSASARDTARWMSTEALTVSVSFDVVNIRAVGRIQRNRLRLIREFTAEQRLATREALSQGITRGLNPRDQARLFRDSIGLTSRQMQSVGNYRRLLTEARMDGLPSRQVLTRALRDARFDRSIQRALREGQPLAPEQVDKMVGRYQERMIRYRSEVIARTEALRSVHEGADEMYRQAIEMGQFMPDDVERTWNDADDRRVRNSHAALDGLSRGLDETFPGANGELRFPGDPEAPGSETIQCRCVLSTRLAPPTNVNEGIPAEQTTAP